MWFQWSKRSTHCIVILRCHNVPILWVSDDVIGPKLLHRCRARRLDGSLDETGWWCYKRGTSGRSRLQALDFTIRNPASQPGSVGWQNANVVAYVTFAEIWELKQRCEVSRCHCYFLSLLLLEKSWPNGFTKCLAPDAHRQCSKRSTGIGYIRPVCTLSVS